MPLTVALYGLSADPPHWGHSLVMKLLSEYYDQVWVWAVDNPLKSKPGMPLAHRQAMVALTTHALNSPCILHRPEFSSPWTAESVAIIHYLYPQHQLWVALGSDALKQVNQWAAVDMLIARINGFVEVARAGQHSDLTALQGLPVHSLTGDIPPYASHEIRHQLNTEHQAAGLIPEVLTYIHQENLYLNIHN